MTTQTITIADGVALKEQVALTEYYRNRNLILAQAVADLQAEVARLSHENEQLKPLPVAADAQEEKD